MSDRSRALRIKRIYRHHHHQPPRGQLNALSGAVVAGLKSAFIRFNQGDDRCAIVTGAGEKAFTAGADLRDPPRNPELWECMPGVGVDVDKPIVAAVSGYCVGRGRTGPVL